MALLILLLAACTPGFAFIQQPGVEPTRQPVTTPPAEVFSGSDGEDILLQLTYEPGFVMPEYRYPFGRTAYFTLLADGRAIYIDENQDSRVMQVQLSQEEAAALLQKVRDLATARGLRVASSQSAAPRDEKGFDRIGLSLRVEGDWEQLVALLRELAQQRPAIFTNTLQLGAQLRGLRDQPQSMFGQLDLYVLKERAKP